MIVRIVKLTISEEYHSDFKLLLAENKSKIKAFKGCSKLEAYQDINEPNLFFTYSYWATEKDLNAYRDSDFFKGVWSRTKAFFCAKPEAWSVDAVV